MSDSYAPLTDPGFSRDESRPDPLPALGLRRAVAEPSLMGSYRSAGFTVEIYFPEAESPDTWTIWVLDSDEVAGEFLERIPVTSVYGVDQATITRLEAAAEAAVAHIQALRRSPTHRKAPLLVEPMEVL